MHVSVALCTYNGARFLEEQLASIAAQTRLPTEMVITDDASSDGTVAILESFASNAPFRVRLRRHTVNLGSTTSFEETIAACQEPLIALCDQDDVWRPDKLERLASALERDAEAGYAFSDAEAVDENLRPLGFHMWETVGLANGAWQEFRGDRQFEMLIQPARVTGATMMIRASRFPLCRPFPRGMVHDRWLATVLSAVGVYGVALNETLVKYRQHEGQQIGSAWTGRRPSLRVQASRDFVLKHRERIRRELAVGNSFIEQLDRLLSRSDALDLAKKERARRSRTLADERIRHIAARVSLDNASLANIGAIIVKELATGSYRRYSGGLRALASDLLYCMWYRDPNGPGAGS